MGRGGCSGPWSPRSMSGRGGPGRLFSLPRLKSAGRRKCGVDRELGGPGGVLPVQRPSTRLGGGSCCCVAGRAVWGGEHERFGIVRDVSGEMLGEEPSEELGDADGAAAVVLGGPVVELASSLPASSEASSAEICLLNLERCRPRSGATSDARAVRVSSTSTAMACLAGSRACSQIMSCWRRLAPLCQVRGVRGGQVRTSVGVEAFRVISFAPRADALVRPHPEPS